MTSPGMGGRASADRAMCRPCRFITSLRGGTGLRFSNGLGLDSITTMPTRRGLFTEGKTMQRLLEKLLEKLLKKPLQKLVRWIDKQNAEADAAREAEAAGVAQKQTAPEAHEQTQTIDESPAATISTKPTAVLISRCVRASCWDGDNAKRRMMNMLSPKFSDSKFCEYLDWMIRLDCDHCHLLLLNEGDGEGAGYRCSDSSTYQLARQRIEAIRKRGLGVILWIVSDDSPNYRKRLFADPDAYIGAMSPLLAYASCVVLGLEMDEGGASLDDWRKVWKSLRKYWSGPVGTHHTSGKYNFISLGDVVMDQLDEDCSTSQIKNSIRNIIAKGKVAFGFEYARKPNASKAMAALEAGAQGVGNWAGGSATTSATTSTTSTTPAASDDAVPFRDLDWCWGSFRPSADAKIVASIATLRVSTSGLSYGWVSGGCESMGATSKTDADHTICALFCRIGGKWRGGKFDWISSSRTTRDFKNVVTGYNGWQKNAVDVADAYAFCVVSADGKRRTNVIMATR